MNPDEIRKLEDKILDIKEPNFPPFILIETEDSDLTKALESLKIEDIFITPPVRQGMDWSSVAQHIVQYSSEGAISFFYFWLYDYLKEHTIRQSSINKRRIPDDKAAIHAFMEMIKNEVKNKKSEPDKT